MIRRLTGAPIAAAAMAAPIVTFGVAAWSRRWMSDDGYIYLRVVRQLIDGNGPVYNRGERVEAATSPLWVGLLAGAKEVFRPVDLAWLAVILGLTLSIAGLAFAQWGAYRLWSRPDGRRRGVIVPFGSLVIVALPPFWDFATSGLETGLAFAWLGVSFWALASTVAADEPRASSFERRSTTFLPALLGLGPLIRPDFALYSVAFVAALLVMRPSMTLRARVRAVALALALPFAYEVFRAGYYAALVPNPAFAKEASSPNVAQGLRYLIDTLRAYWLFVPTLLIASALALQMRGGRAQRNVATLVGATIAAALAHGAYVVYIGGDFMHARMLLPAIFALAMPFAVIEIEDWRVLVPAAGLLAWAVICAVVLRPSYDGIGPHGIANERAYYVSLARNAHPVTLDDYRQDVGVALALIERAELRPNHLLLATGDEQLPLRSDLRAEGVVFSSSIGIFGYVFDNNVRVVDVHGLADPIAGRLELASRGRPGHEKVLPEAWIVARVADPSAAVSGARPMIDVAAARGALACGDIADLIGATSGAMTPRRFAHNLVDTFRLHRLRIPPEPVAAREKLC